MLDAPKWGYKFTYDNVGRVKLDTYGEGDAITYYGKYTEGVGYDTNSSVTSITRYGKHSLNSFGLMDCLTLTYDGNWQTGVTEAAVDYDTTGTFEYKKANGS